MQDFPNNTLVLLTPINNFDPLFFELLGPVWLEKEPKRHCHHNVDEGPGEQDYQ